jgi:nitrogen regulatory protein P-II 1
MKKIEAIIRPVKFDDVKAALAETRYGGITVTEVEGHGTQKGYTQVWRGREYKVELLPKIKMEIVCTDQEAPQIIRAILDSGRTGQAGDGKIFVSSISEAYRISSGEEGDKVISASSSTHIKPRQVMEAVFARK